MSIHSKQYLSSIKTECSSFRQSKQFQEKLGIKQCQKTIKTNPSFLMQYYSILGKLPQLKKQQLKRKLVSGNIRYFQNGNSANSGYKITQISSSQNFEVISIQFRLPNFQFSIKILNVLQEIHNINNLDRIASGSYGDIYRNSNDGRQYAIKCIQYRLQQKKYSQFLFEGIKQFCIAKLLSILRIGPRIQDVFGFDLLLFDSCLEFPMELCNQANKEINFEDLSQNLKLMHSFRIIHGDIKPANMLYSNCYQKWVFCDFGFSQNILCPIGYKTQTHAFGTLQFLSKQMIELANKSVCQEDLKQYIDLYYNDLIGFLKSKQQKIDKKYQQKSQTSSNKKLMPEYYLFQIFKSQQTNKSNDAFDYVIFRLKFFLYNNMLNQEQVETKILGLSYEQKQALACFSTQIQFSEEAMRFFTRLFSYHANQQFKLRKIYNFQYLLRQQNIKKQYIERKKAKFAYRFDILKRFNETRNKLFATGKTIQQKVAQFIKWTPNSNQIQRYVLFYVELLWYRVYQKNQAKNQATEKFKQTIKSLKQRYCQSTKSGEKIHQVPIDFIIQFFNARKQSFSVILRQLFRKIVIISYIVCNQSGSIEQRLLKMYIEVEDNSLKRMEINFIFFRRLQYTILLRYGDKSSVQIQQEKIIEQASQSIVFSQIKRILCFFWEKNKTDHSQALHTFLSIRKILKFQFDFLDLIMLVKFMLYAVGRQNQSLFDQILSIYNQQQFNTLRKNISFIFVIDLKLSIQLYSNDSRTMYKKNRDIKSKYFLNEIPLILQIQRDLYFGDIHERMEAEQRLILLREEQYIYCQTIKSLCARYLMHFQILFNQNLPQIAHYTFKLLFKQVRFTLQKFGKSIAYQPYCELLNCIVRIKILVLPCGYSIQYLLSQYTDLYPHHLAFYQYLMSYYSSLHKKKQQSLEYSWKAYKSNKNQKQNSRIDALYLKNYIIRLSQIKPGQTMEQKNKLKIVFIQFYRKCLQDTYVAELLFDTTLSYHIILTLLQYQKFDNLILFMEVYNRIICRSKEFPSYLSRIVQNIKQKITQQEKYTIILQRFISFIKQNLISTNPTLLLFCYEIICRIRLIHQKIRFIILKKIASSMNLLEQSLIQHILKTYYQQFFTYQNNKRKVNYFQRKAKKLDYLNKSQQKIADRIIQKKKNPRCLANNQVQIFQKCLKKKLKTKLYMMKLI